MPVGPPESVLVSRKTSLPGADFIHRHAAPIIEVLRDLDSQIHVIRGFLK
jgi:hypothetical protein